MPIEDTNAQLQLEKAAEDKASAAKKLPEIEVPKEKADVSETLSHDETIALKAKAEEEAAAAATVPQQKQLKKRKPSKELPIEDTNAQLQLEKAAEDKASAAKKVPEIEVAKADVSETLTSDETIALKAKAEEEAAAAATVPQQKQLKKRKPSKELPIEEATAQLQLEKTEVEKGVEKPTEAVDETPIMSGFAPVEEEKKAKKKVSKKKVDEVSEGRCRNFGR